YEYNPEVTEAWMYLGMIGLLVMRLAWAALGVVGCFYDSLKHGRGGIYDILPTGNGRVSWE
ncbi:MAG: hypothetical protein P3W93_009770, partial [Thermus sp.]|nr:hypothetical protein [Thermus sp.]